MNNKDDCLERMPESLRGTYPALVRAGRIAREKAIQTNTGIVIYENGRVRYISAQELINAEAQGIHE